VVAEVIASTNRARNEEFLLGLATEGYLEQFLAKEALDSVATELGARLGKPQAPGPAGGLGKPQAPGSAGGARMGNTTHLAVIDADGACATVTCSNGSCSGVIVPGTGMHLNNMLGEQDLNPHGYHRHAPGARVPSMMAPTLVLREGVPEVALGSAGSNRIRSAIIQTILGVVDHGLHAAEAVRRPRIHVEGGVVEAEPGAEEEALERLEANGWTVRRWSEQNLFFGGVQAVARDRSGELSGGGDPRRGGVATVVA
jgi:gamma-glutamyltranspeptidase/glutathione hydrolase